MRILPEKPKKILQLTVEPEEVLLILELLQGVTSSEQIQMFGSEKLPSVDDAKSKAFEDLAQRIAKKIRPTAKQALRREALQFALQGGDTFPNNLSLTLGDHGDTRLRNALGALSKALRPIFTLDASPIDRIAHRSKSFSKEGVYLGTSYRATRLGARVLEILKDEGVL